MTVRPILFTGLDGPIILPSTQAFAPYAAPFLHWATTVFSVSWLSRRGAAPAISAAENLGLHADAISIASFAKSPVEAVALAADPFWLDGGLTPEVRGWGKSKFGARFIEVDAGVTPEHRARLLELLRAGPDVRRAR